jgi:copper chaperone CopZ
MMFVIDGMTCINCQNKIEKRLNSQEGVIRASVNFSKDTADIEYDENKISKEKIIKQVEELDYRVLRKNRNSFSDILDSVGIVFVILSLFWLFQTSGVLNLLSPAGLADTNMGYGMLFVIGVVTSVHCISMRAGTCHPGSYYGWKWTEGRVKWKQTCGRKSVFHPFGGICIGGNLRESGCFGRRGKDTVIFCGRWKTGRSHCGCGYNERRQAAGDT